MRYATQGKDKAELNRLYPEDIPVHDWYRFVLSYPPHLVRTYIERFGLSSEHVVLDPFCGTGTTIVECKKLGIPSVGIEANPFVYFAARTKVDWGIDPEGLVIHAKEVAAVTQELITDQPFAGSPLFGTNESPLELRTLTPEQQKLIITNSISPRPLHKVLVLLETLNDYCDSHFFDHEKLALAKQLVYSISNLRFGPEVGIGKVKEDAAVVSLWLNGVQAMANDLRVIGVGRNVPAIVHFGDARELDAVLEPGSIDAIITSPPYPNEKDYSRTTRLESVLLGFLKSRKDLREHKSRLLRSNTRNVYKNDNDSNLVANNARVEELANLIEERRIELGKMSGFERLYARVVRLYFGGMARHLEGLKPKLRPGAQLAYVVGDQASYFRIMIRTGEILAEIAEQLGYEVIGIDLFRTRFSTATQEYLREEVVLLRWNVSR
jgi:hypothetical protein